MPLAADADVNRKISEDMLRVFADHGRIMGNPEVIGSLD
jgi:hypothetical protein